MKFEEYALSILKTTEDSYVGLELDLRFDIVEFIMKNLSSPRMTQSKLAAKLKMKPSQLNRILKAESNLTLETIARIFHAFSRRPSIKEKFDIHEAIGENYFSGKKNIVYETPTGYSIVTSN
jgi:plasmid maintenance system antidote protein VapI